MRQLLVDHVPFYAAQISLVEGVRPGSNGNMRLKGKLQEAEVKNGNGRVYPREVLVREVDNYIKEFVNTKTAMGELDHPESNIVNLKNTSHLITKIWWEDNNLMGELELLNTPSGKIAQEIIRAGIPLGISSRGMGSVKQIGENVEVQDDFALLCWDLVSVPSTPNAHMKLSEGKNTKYTNKYESVNSLITEIICTTTGVCPIC